MNNVILSPRSLSQSMNRFRSILIVAFENFAMVFKKPFVKRSFTVDEASQSSARSRFYTKEQIGPRRSLTPEGFLVCYDVPIARTGEMLYGPDDDIPIEPGNDGLIRIMRDASEVFSPKFITSFMGKPVVNDHPPVAVTPLMWKEVAVGAVLNPRRGEGTMIDLLLADMIICDADAIAAVDEGKREVSCGYDADYEEISQGVGRQKNMVGNHVALVDSGRCGPRCAIGDRKTSKIHTGDSSMASTKKLGWLDRIREALKTKDEKAVKKVLDDAEEELEAEDETPTEGDPSGESHIHVHAGGGDRRMSDDDLETRFKSLEDGHSEILSRLDAMAPPSDQPGVEEEGFDAAIEGNLKEEAPAGTTDATIKATKDSSLLSESFQDTVAMAEILVPGIQVPTYDRAAQPKTTLDAMCKLRRTAIDLAYATPDGRAAIEEFHGKKPTLDSMSCKDVRTLFRGAVAVRKASNRAAQDRNHQQDTTIKAVTALTPAQLNKRNAEFYKRSAN